MSATTLIVNILREVTSGRGYSLVDCNRARVFTWVITRRNKFPCEERGKPMCGESKTPSTPRSGFTSANVSTSSPFFFFALSRRRKTRFRFVRMRFRRSKRARSRFFQEKYSFRCYLVSYYSFFLLSSRLRLREETVIKYKTLDLNREERSLFKEFRKLSANFNSNNYS